jgi:L-ascorbate metabolism protein UlaG (beta-lactamase superfamily)
MARSLLLVLMLAAVVAAPVGAAPAATDTLWTADGQPVVLHAFGHASLALIWPDLTVIVDPVGGAGRHAAAGRPDIVLVTHRHGDHFDPDTIRDLDGDHVMVITPPDVAESIPSNDPIVMQNGDAVTVHGLRVEAVPAYNRTPGRLDFHPRGRDNGYVLEHGGLRVYVSGDTEDIPEMASLGPVDAALLCMNLPFTMSVAQAAEAVAMIAPRVLYPYHFRNRDGSLSDLEELGRLLAAGDGDGAGAGAPVEIRVLDWYPTDNVKE